MLVAALDTPPCGWPPGAVLAIHGTQHLFGWFDGPSLDRYKWLVESLGYEPARLVATVGGISEVVGGLLLILGLLTPLGVATAVGVTGNAVISNLAGPCPASALA